MSYPGIKEKYETEINFHTENQFYSLTMRFGLPMSSHVFQAVDHNQLAAMPSPKKNANSLDGKMIEITISQT